MNVVIWRKKSILIYIVHSLTATAHFYKQAYTTAVVLLPVYTTAAVQFMKNEDGSVIPPWDHKQVHVYFYISIQGPHYPSNIGGAQNLLRVKRWMWPEVQSPDGQITRRLDGQKSLRSEGRIVRILITRWPEVQWPLVGLEPPDPLPKWRPCTRMTAVPCSSAAIWCSSTTPAPLLAYSCMIL